MKTITYANKVALYENPNVNNINKVRDVDINELKEVINDNVQEYTDMMGVSSNTWSSSATYTIDDIVIYNNVFYKNITGTNTATTPDSDTTNWQKTTLIQNSKNNSQSNTYSCDYINDLNTYSTNEIDTGKVWIDGKKIYRKVISNFTMPSGTTKIIDSTLKNSYIDTLLSAQGSYTVSSNSYRRLIPWVDRSDVTAQIGFTITTNGAQLNCGATAAEGINGIMIVEYTKSS